MKNENTHWDNQNAVWHYRKTKRATVEDGRSVYFLEEVQSDWHQAGRDEGYMTREEQDMHDEYKSLMNLQLDVGRKFWPEKSDN